MERRANRSAYVSRSRKIFKKKKRPYMPLIREVAFGRTTSAKLRIFGTLQTGSSGPMNTVLAMVQQLQTSNDWSDFSTSYQFYNVNKITVQIIPMCGAIAFSTVSNGLCGIAYSGIDNAAVTGFSQLVDHENFITWSINFADPNTAQRYFKIKPKVNAQPPFPTNSTAEHFGYLRTYSNFVATGTVIPCCNYIITFTCSFTGQA